VNRPESLVTVRAAVAIGSALAAVAAVLADVGAPVQPALVMWFVLVCPGMALVGIARPSSLVFAACWSVAISCALAAVVAQAMLFAGMWSPALGLIGLAEITFLGCATELLAEVRARRLAVAPPTERP
jgi:hypothetical protein